MLQRRREARGVLRCLSWATYQCAAVSSRKYKEITRHGITFDGSTYTLRLLLSDEHACSRVNRSAMFPLILNNSIYFCSHSRYSHELTARICRVRHGKKQVRDAVEVALRFEKERVNVQLQGIQPIITIG